MKKVSVRISCLIVTVMLLCSAMAGCGSTAKQTGGDTAKTPEATTTDTAGDAKAKDLKPVELQFYMVGDAPKDLQDVSDKLNELSKKDLNCTVKFNYTSWTDFSQKYNLLISTGQPIDLIYTAAWLDYSKLAKKGAFKILDELLPRYAPELYKFVPENYWNQVKVDGKIYTVPGTWKEYVTDGFQYRKDLQEKFGLPEPNTLENVEKYLEGVKKNLPGQIITMEYPQPGPGSWSFSALEILSMKYKWVNFGTPYGLVADYDDPSNLKVYWGSPEFIEDMKMFKRWADKGFWSRSALSAKADMTAFDTGKVVAVIQGQNPSKFSASVTKLETSMPGTKVGYIPYPAVNGIAQAAHATQNGYAIPSSAQNPERALMFYQKLVLDKTYNQLSEYGIKDKHYTEKDGYYEPVGDPTTSGFAREGMNGWAWRNTGYMLYPKSYDTVKTIFADLDKIAEKTKFKGINIFDGFGEDYTSYQSERAALGTVLTQYLAPLEAGLVPDVEAATKTFMEKAKASGLEKIQTEYIKQWKAYCNTYNYK